MNENPRRRLLRRARLTTAAIAVTAVTGTAALTAVAQNATATGAGSGSGNGGDNNHRTVSRQGQVRSSQGGIGVVQVPSSSQPQGGSNAS